MNKQETAKIVTIIQELYPVYYRNYSEDQTATMVQVWSMALDDIPYNEINKAVVRFVKEHTNGFPPNPAELRKLVYESVKPKDEMTGLEAWNVVRKALSRSGWYSTEEFKKLPKDIQRIVGSPNMLYEWSQTDSDQVGTVIASHFIKSYNAYKERESKTIMSDYKAMIGHGDQKLLDVLKELEEHTKM